MSTQSLAAVTRRAVAGTVRVAKLTWTTVLERHEQLSEVLGLSREQLEVFGDSPRFRSSGLVLSVGRHQFAIVCRHVCGPHYGHPHWIKLLMVYCEDDPALNIRVGVGTCEIFTIREDVFAEVLSEIGRVPALPERRVRPLYSHWVF